MGKNKKKIRYNSMNNINAICENELNEDLKSPLWLIPLSARDKEALKNKMEDLYVWLNEDGQAASMSDISFTLFARRRHFNERAIFMVQDYDELLKLLKKGQNGDGESVLSNSVHNNRKDFDDEVKEKGNVLLKSLNTLYGEESRQELIDVAKYYIRGYDLEWRNLFDGKNPKCLSMPTYPFSRERYWAEADDDQRQNKHKVGAAKLHSLIGENTSDLREQKFTTVFDGSEYFISDHIINGYKVLPGAVFLEMARAAGSIASKVEVAGIKDIVWLNPIVFGKKEGVSEEKEISISLYPINACVEYEIWTEADGVRTINSQGKLTFGSSVASGSNDIDILSISSRLKTIKGSEECYDNFISNGVNYGKGFTLIKELRTGDNEALGHLEMPSHLKEKYKDLKMHPSMLDAAFQTVAGLMSDKYSEGEVYLPFAVEGIEVYAAIEQATYAYAVKASNNAGKQSIPKYDIVIADESGKGLLKIKGFMLKNQSKSKIEVEDNAFAKHESQKFIEVEEALENVVGGDINVRLEAFLKEILSSEIRIPGSRISSSETFDNFGIDSVMIISLTRRLEQHFGELPKTLFFEYRTLSELSEYFIKNHDEFIKNKFSHNDIRKVSTISKNRSADIKKTVNRFSSRNYIEENNEVLKELDIAIVGISGRYPMADDLDEYWQNLSNGKDCITEIPEDRWDNSKLYDPDKNKNDRIYTKWGGFINDVDKFDPLFFNISPKEAELMDPQERIFLETVWHAIEDAGYAKSSLDRKKVGVFVGVMYGHYQLFGAEESMKGNLISLGGSYASIANRVSYYFNFHGPSMALDTMCSSSLTAIHLACDSIRKGESEMAVAGGVNVTVHPNKYVLLSQSKFASSDGRCRSFGEGGDGYVPGEGVGAVLLKPLNKALEDKDHIYGVIKGSAINHGGKTNGYTVPNPNAQSEVISEALKISGINPRAISYLEAHGTGTSLGDPIEINGLVKAFDTDVGDTGFCAIGSVKSNIGHLESASGIAGLTKVLLQMKHNQLVPSIHSEKLNSAIDFAKTPFVVQRELEPWEPPVVSEGGIEKSYPRIAGISSFGAGGSNAHLIIEEYTSKAEMIQHSGDEVIIFSARNNEVLLAYASKIIDFIKSNKTIDLAELAYTFKVGREAFNERVAVVVGSVDELLEKLSLFVHGKEYIERLYKGSVKPDNSFIWLEGEAGKAYIEAIMKNDEIDKIAALWVGGATLDWNLFYSSETPKRISAPTYPFSKERYWVPVFDDKKSTTSFGGYSNIHPLVGRNISDLSEQKYVSEFSGKEFFFTDHKVRGKMMMPGAAIAEMARCAGELASGRKVSEIKNIIWERPVVLERDINGRDHLELFIGIYPNKQDIKYEVWTNHVNEERNIHSQGTIIYDEESSKALETLDIQAINNSFADVMDKERLYGNFSKGGFDYGKSFRTVKTIRYGRDEALGLVELPDEAYQDMEILKLHPSILDGAFQVMSVLAGNEGSDENVYIPFAIDSLKLLKPLSRKLWVYATRKEAVSGTIGYDLKIADENGDILILIEGFTVKAVKGAANNQYKTLLYTNSWKSEVLKEKYTIGNDEKYIVFVKDEALEKSFREVLNRRDILVVKPSSSFAKAEDTIEILPSSYDDYIRLLDSFVDVETKKVNIIHIWSEPIVSSASVGVGETFDLGINSLFLLSKALFEKKVRSKVSLLYAYAYDNEAALPQLTSVGAFAKTVNIENPSYMYKTVGVPLDFWKMPSRYLKSVINELGNEQGNSIEIRLSNDNRLVRKMAECIEDDNIKSVSLRPNGVYIITGGAGGIGLAFAEYIASKQKSIIVLTGRSELTSDKEALINKIRAKGSEVHYIKSDISKKEDVEFLTYEVRRRFNHINGVIHSAGIIRDSFILKKDFKDFEEVVAPKLYGSIWLDNATIGDNLDFFVLFSSVSSVMGNAGQCDYAFANSFMDYFAMEREFMVQSGKRFGKSVSIAWPLWKEGGMSVNAETEAYMLEKAGIVPLDKEAGFEAFERALNMSLSHIIVFKGNDFAIRNFFSKEITGNIEKANNVLDNSEVAEGDIDKLKVEEFLKKIVSKEIKLSPESISCVEALERYGIDSVMIVNMTRALEDVFGNLPKTLFFEYQTIKGLSGYFINNHKSKLAAILGSGVKKEAVYDIKAENTLVSKNDLKSYKNTRFEFLGTNNHTKYQREADDVAIIGVSGRYPMAKDLDEFWENLKAGRDCISEIPRERWDFRKYTNKNKDGLESYLGRWGGFIDDVDSFDTLFFNISPREAKMMDPQERLFLQTVWHTMEDAGYTRENLWGKNVGVFVGAMYGQYQLFGTENVDIIPSSSYASIANRASFFFNFHGPSIALDTMCSSSLTSIHMACESIKSKEIEYAVAGGVNVTIHPNKYLVLSQGKFMASDGRCRSFGEGGDGYVPGEGVGAVILKSLSDAIRDGDRIYAVIKGSSINHGGKTNGFTVPNPNAQAELIHETLKKSGIDPKNISYIEAHGTGTSLGDPIEIAGLNKAFKRLDAGNNYCPIGSVKSNIGHLESAAGIAGLTKILLQMKNKKLVPSIHSEVLNPNIDFEDCPFYVQKELSDWNPLIVFENGVKKVLPRTACISSFGAGGSNAHIILEEYVEKSNELMLQEDGKELIIMSVKNTDVLKNYVKNFIKYISRKSVIGAVVHNKEDIVRKLSQDLVKIASDVLGVGREDIFIYDYLIEFGFDAVKFNLLENEIYNVFEVQPLDNISISTVTMEEIAQKLYINNKEYFENYYSQGLVELVAKEETSGNEGPTLSDIAFTLQTGREAMEERLAVIAGSKSELIERLQEFLENGVNTSGIFYGNINKEQNRLRLFDEDDDLQEIIKNWVKKGKLSKVAELWVNGISIDWGLLNEGKPQSKRKVSLPLYPFTKERHWIAHLQEKTSRQNECIHPLIDCIDAGMSFSNNGVVFRKNLEDTELIVMEHQVLENPIIPGVGYLEMAYTAVKQIRNEDGIILSNVVLMQPVSAKDGKTEVFIKVKDLNNAIGFEVQTKKGQSYTTHVKGEALIENRMNQAVNYSIKEIKDRCKGKLGKEEIYSTLYGMGIKYGQYFQTLEEICWNNTEAIGTIRLSQLYEGELIQYTLHPTIMDATLQTVIGLAMGLNITSPMLPYAIDEVRVLKPLKQNMYSYVTIIGKDRFDIKLLDENGYLCVEMNDVVVRELKNPIEELLYTPVWKREILNVEKEKKGTEKENVLIIYSSDDMGVVKAISQKHHKGIVTELVLGDKTEIISDTKWSIQKDNIDDYTKAIKGIYGIDTIFFLGGLQRGCIKESQVLEYLDESQESGVLALFRLVKALNANGYKENNIQLKIVTCNAAKVLPNNVINPLPASIFGLTKTIAKEYTNWKVCCVDVDFEGLYEESLECTLDAVLNEPANQKGDEVAIRDGLRYVKVIKGVSTPASKDQPFRKNGVYLILGGAGGIGLEISRYLAESVQAKLVLVGRSELKDETKTKIRVIEAKGGKVLYLKADATDVASMEEALQKAKEVFGDINGVIHSAIVLKDKTIERMDEETFSQVISPKVKGTAVLYEVFGKENLDFMMFFSSMQSFSGNVGQGNYAAGCTFKDAFAQYIGQNTQYPVKIINWGFWGSTGIVASEEYRKRMKAQGVDSIMPAEGIEVIKRTLDSQLNQIIAIKAEKKMLKLMGFDLNSKLNLYPNKGKTLGEKTFNGAIVDGDFVDHADSNEAFKELELLGLDMLLRTLNNSGLFKTGRDEYSLNEIKAMLGVISSYERLLEEFICILESHGYLCTDGKIIVFSEKIIRDGLKSEIDIENKKYEMLSKYPQLEPHVNLLQICFGSLPQILKGMVPAPEVIFPNASMSLVEDVYKGNEMADYYNTLVARSVLSYVENAKKYLQHGEVIRILEVGAGTGGTSDGVLKAINKYGSILSYDYTDVSSSFLHHGRKHYSARNPFVKFKVLNIENSIIEQGYKPGEYDIIIAANVLHATSNMRNTLRNIKFLLKTDGLLLINEATQKSNFTTFVFGLLDGWWLYEDSQLRLKYSPLLDVKLWRRLLSEEGFERIAVLGSPKNGSAETGQNVLLAQSNGIVMDNLTKVPFSQDESLNKSLVVKPENKITRKPYNLMSEKTANMAGAKIGNESVKQHIEKTITGCIENVLEVNSRNIQKDRQFAEYGVDSVTGVELINKINNELSIVLKTTALFDYPNINALTDFIFGKYEASIRKSMTVEDSIVEASSKVSGEYDSTMDLFERLAKGEISADKVYRAMEEEKYGK